MEKKYHKSRKFLIIVLALVFLNSVVTLKLRAYQRSQNLTAIKMELKNRYTEKIFIDIENKSRKEDMWLLIGINMLSLGVIVGFDRFGVFEKTDDTVKANKKKVVEGIKMLL